MHAESRINPRAVNKISNATALIQFMPKTAKGL
jgi:soluble lytic murein transglycosylase-like protein